MSVTLFAAEDDTNPPQYNSVAVQGTGGVAASLSLPLPPPPQSMLGADVESSKSKEAAAVAAEQPQYYLSRGELDLMVAASASPVAAHGPALPVCAGVAMSHDCAVYVQEHGQRGAGAGAGLATFPAAAETKSGVEFTPAVAGDVLHEDPVAGNGGEDGDEDEGDAEPYNDNLPVRSVSDAQYVKDWGSGTSALSSVGTMLRRVPGVEMAISMADRVSLSAPSSSDLWKGKIRMSAAQNNGEPDVARLVEKGLPVKFWYGVAVAQPTFVSQGFVREGTQPEPKPEAAPGPGPGPEQESLAPDEDERAPVSAYANSHPTNPEPEGESEGGGEGEGEGEGEGVTAEVLEVQATPVAPARKRWTGDDCTVEVDADVLYRAARSYYDVGPGRERAGGSRQHVFLDVLIRAGVTLRHLHSLGVCWEDLVGPFGLLAHHLRNPDYMDGNTLRYIRLYPPGSANANANARGVNLDTMLRTVPGLTPDRLLNPRAMGGVGASVGAISNLHCVPPTVGDTPLKCLIKNGLTTDAFARVPIHREVWELVLGLTRADLHKGISPTNDNLRSLVRTHGWTAQDLHETYGFERARLMTLGVPVPTAWIPAQPHAGTSQAAAAEYTEEADASSMSMSMSGTSGAPRGRPRNTPRRVVTMAADRAPSARPREDRSSGNGARRATPKNTTKSTKREASSMRTITPSSPDEDYLYRDAHTKKKKKGGSINVGPDAGMRLDMPQRNLFA
jgi:hypothetical protein